MPAIFSFILIIGGGGKKDGVGEGRKRSNGVCFVGRRNILKSGYRPRGDPIHLFFPVMARRAGGPTNHRAGFTMTMADDETAYPKALKNGCSRDCGDTALFN
jgi:hypothetical protein